MMAGPSRATSRPLSSRHERLFLMAGTALQTVLLAQPLAAQPAPSARPAGGQVSAGQAVITQNPTTTTITQTSQRAAVDWHSFDVGAAHSVTFAQPGSTAITLNRVTGPDPSAIAGRISANGQIVITNPSGVVFYQGAQVNAQSLIVSSAGITNRNFMAGQMVFDQPGKPDALIANSGSITVQQAGLAALVAPQVANHGVITARMGRAVLAGAEAHTLDLYGDGMLSIDITRQVQQAPRGTDGKPVAALVTNTGTIRADGGVVLLTAAAADGIVSNLVNAGGVVRADSAGGQPGRIEISGTGGSLIVEGRVSAAGRAPGSTGGQVAVVADGTTTVAATARINASGQAGGGKVAIGSRPGAASTSATAVIAKGAVLRADARQTGDGGRVTVLGGATQMAGRITARGGRQSGSGGFVEVSGKSLQLTGSIDVSASNGQLGTILIDPTNLTIVATGTDTVTPVDNVDPNVAAGAGGANDTITRATLEALTGNVHLQATNDITVATSLDLTRPLTLEAGHNVTVNAGSTITTSTGTTLIASSAAIAGFTSDGAVVVLGNLVVRDGGISLQSGTGGIALSGLLSAASVNLDTTGAVTQPGGGIISTLLTGSAASVALNSSSNQVGTLRNFAATTGDFSLVNATPLTVGAVRTGGQVSVTAGHTISLTTDSITVNPDIATGTPPNTISAPGGTISIQPFTAGQPLELISGGTANTKALSVSSSDRSVMNADVFRFGSPTAGPIVLAADGRFLDLVTGVPNPTTTGSKINGGFTSVVLQSGGAISQSGGVRLPVLSGSAASLTLETSFNQIAALGAFTATGALSVTGQDLVVQGPVNAGSITLTSNGDLSLTGDVRGSDVRLTAVGSSGGSGSSGSGGNILQTAGVVTAGTLTGSATALGSTTDGNATLTGQNLVGTLGPFTTSRDFQFTNAQGLNVTGAVGSTGLGDTTLKTTGSLALGATSAISNLTFDATGNVTQADGSALQGSLGGRGAGVALTSSGNRFTTPGPITATNGDLTLAAPTALSLDALATTGTISVTGQTLQLLGDVRGSDVRLVATGSTGACAPSPGSISQQGGIIAAGSLSGDAGLGSVTLNQQNLIGSLGGFTSGDSFQLTDTQALQVSGQVGGTATTASTSLTTGGLALGAASSITNLNFNASGAVTQDPGSILSGRVTGTATSVALTSAANRVTTAGPLTATQGDLALTTSSLLQIVGTISVPDTHSLALTADVITGPARTIAGTAFLVAQGGTVALAPLTAGRPVELIAGTFTNDAALSIGPGLLAGVATGTLQLGSAGAGPILVGNAGDAIDLTGRASTLRLLSGGDITQGAGASLTVNTLTGQARNATLQGNNRIANLGAFVVGNDFALVDLQSLTVTGPVTDGGLITLNVFGDLTIAGPMTANSVALAATGGVTQTAGLLSASNSLALSVGGDVVQTGGSIATGLLAGQAGSLSLPGTANAVEQLGPFNTRGDFLLRNARDLTVAGAVDPGDVSFDITGNLLLRDTVTGTTVSLVATGAINETGSGAVIATTLTGRGATVSLGGANNVINLGDFNSATSLLLNDIRGLALNGVVSANAFQVAIAGDLVQAGGVLSAGSLTGTVGGTVRLGTGGVASIGTLGDFRAGGTGFTLANSTPLTIGGTIATTNLAISAPGAVTLNGGQITTGGLPLAQQSGATPTAPGTYLQVLADTAGRAAFTQTGVTTFLPTGAQGTPALRIDVTGSAGTASFENLFARGFDLVLGTGGGTASGTMQVGNLLVLGGGRVNLSGSVAGVADTGAAQIARVATGFNPQALFNGCIIGSVTCSPPPPEPLFPGALSFLFPNSIGSIVAGVLGVPLTPAPLTLGILSPTARRDDEDPDLPLPNVSDRDF